MARLVYITGASGGIGQALALRFYQAGYALALVARRTTETAQWALDEQLQSDRYRVYAADVSDINSAVSAGEACMREQGVPDVIIANAGISVGMDTAVRADLDVMARLFCVNNVGMAATFHPFIGAMRQRRTGVLVGIGSVNGIRGFAGHGAYCASKAAVIGYCESLRGEMRASGVQVVTLCPGYIDTPLTQGNPYAMPFLMPATDFANTAFAAIEAGTSYRVIPWQMGIVAKLLRILPNRVFDSLFAGRKRKRRADEA